MPIIDKRAAARIPIEAQLGLDLDVPMAVSNADSLRKLQRRIAVASVAMTRDRESFATLQEHRAPWLADLESFVVCNVQPELRSALPRMTLVWAFLDHRARRSDSLPNINKVARALLPIIWLHFRRPYSNDIPGANGLKVQRGWKHIALHLSPAPPLAAGIATTWGDRA